MKAAINAARRALLILLAFVCGALAAAPKPNVILILADDPGWADLGGYGNTFNETPNLDRLARGGMRVGVMPWPLGKRGTGKQRQ